MERVALFAQQINHGQSEIWLGMDGKELTLRRTLATNEVVDVTRRHCDPEVFKAFLADYYRSVGPVVTLRAHNIGEIATEFRLRASGVALP